MCVRTVAPPQSRGMEVAGLAILFATAAVLAPESAAGAILVSGGVCIALAVLDRFLPRRGRP